jgi:hypothetical protein
MFIGVVGGTLAPEVFKYSASRALTVVILGYIGAGMSVAFMGRAKLKCRRGLLYRSPQIVGLDDQEDGVWPCSLVNLFWSDSAVRMI